MPVKRFTSEERRQMREMYKAGASRTEIARAFNTSSSAVAPIVGGLEQQANGHEIRRTPYQEIYNVLQNWTPGQPFSEIPLPVWALRLLGLESEAGRGEREEVKRRRRR